MACDMGVELARVLVTRLDGGSVGRGEVALAATLGVKERLAAVVEAVDALLGRAGLSRDEVWAVGVATTGIVDAAGTVVLSSRLPG
ncbi:hypothetical protein G7085_16425 [Tessaracoccus sp. HDW20]|uniref:hypothetical protein n=1 Tax=Tessaracoccus coleopterorum TaxID=2714950 RepID=UPI0018D45421|nr:hypothetical protein [Tessaracoccus coleopterorum]NHB85645.1 hypothetical protein [Tessaracoccus coleopterorum]